MADIEGKEIVLRGSTGMAYRESVWTAQQHIAEHGGVDLCSFCLQRVAAIVALEAGGET